MLKASPHAQEDGDAMRQKAREGVAKLAAMRLTKAMETVQNGIEETLAYVDFPSEHWRRIRTNNPLERLNREIRRRTRVVAAFPDGQSALMLISARLRHVASTARDTKRYLDIDHLTTGASTAPTESANMGPPTALARHLSTALIPVFDSCGLGGPSLSKTGAPSKAAATVSATS